MNACKAFEGKALTMFGNGCPLKKDWLLLFPLFSDNSNADSFKGPSMLFEWYTVTVTVALSWFDAGHRAQSLCLMFPYKKYTWYHTSC
jgi:hypothetical protein